MCSLSNNAAFHQDLHVLIIIFGPTVKTMDHPKFIASNQKEGY